MGFAFGFAVVTELAHGLTAYRSAELIDLVAGLLGALFGATVNQIMVPRALQRFLGALIAMGGVRVYLTLSRVGNRLD